MDAMLWEHGEPPIRKGLLRPCEKVKFPGEIGVKRGVHIRKDNGWYSSPKC